jgi:hypothetical protein
MRTFLLMLGSAFFGVLLFVAAVCGYFYWQHSRVGPEGTVRFPPRNETTVAEAPVVVERERFYGTHASLAGKFSPTARKTVLAAGPGKIVGSVASSGRPLQGLRLRLALNGSVMSQWASTGADGRYEVLLPYGKYRIDGYELDSSAAHSLLAGKTDGPRHQFFHQRDVMSVAEGKPGQGIDFGYVDPVRKQGPSGDIKLGGPVIVTWEAYPGAAAYRLQLIEQREPRDYESQRRVFEWRERPVVSVTRADLSEHKAELKKDHYYTVEIEALDERRQALSQSPRSFDKADFRVVE